MPVLALHMHHRSPVETIMASPIQEQAKHQVESGSCLSASASEELTTCPLPVMSSRVIPSRIRPSPFVANGLSIQNGVSERALSRSVVTPPFTCPRPNRDSSLEFLRSARFISGKPPPKERVPSVPNGNLGRTNPWNRSYPLSTMIRILRTTLTSVRFPKSLSL